MTKKQIKRSPLFYVGDKYKLLPSISQLFPDTINKFIEPFTGGGSVFLNTNANEYHLNDINKHVVGLHQYLLEQSNRPEQFFNEAQRIIEEYGLSHSYIKDIVPKELKDKWKKTYYAKYNKEGFNRLKRDYNTGEANTYLHFYILLIFGFNRMIRFNSRGEYNLPVGNVDFNQNTKKALEDYFETVSRKEIQLYNQDFVTFLEGLEFEENDFVYLDPPYLITFSEYNKLWNDHTEDRLLQKLSELNQIGIKFAISNVTHYKGKINYKFLDWSNDYNSHSIKSNYISYHDNSNKEFREVLVSNY